MYWVQARLKSVSALASFVRQVHNLGIVGRVSSDVVVFGLVTRLHGRLAVRGGFLLAQEIVASSRTKQISRRCANSVYDSFPPFTRSVSILAAIASSPGTNGLGRPSGCVDLPDRAAEPAALLEAVAT